MKGLLQGISWKKSDGFMEISEIEQQLSKKHTDLSKELVKTPVPLRHTVSDTVILGWVLKIGIYNSKA